jgi:glucose-6-phosphate isomerase
MGTVLNTTPLHGFTDPASGFRLDLSGMRLDLRVLECLTTRQVWKGGEPPAPACTRAHEQMLEIEKGAIKNPDEGRKVTHFTDRCSYTETALFRQAQDFAAAVQAGTVPGDGTRIEAVIVNGIGGSALGPQLLQFALNGPYWNELPPKARRGFPRIYFLDNTDSAGVQDVLRVVELSSTLTVTISKGGGTKETQNNLRALQAAYARAGVDFLKRAVAVTMADAEKSALYKEATAAKWLPTFPMADSIGGRTSETNIVGHVPAALAGIDFRAFVEGARYMDEVTRKRDPADNPAYQLALSWYIAGNGRGDRNMAIVPYSDRLVLLSRYLQQLVMESLGKERALDGRVVNQGLTVFGNKGGTDAHAYIQQLNDGRDDFFVTFIEVLKDAEEIVVEPGLTMGDYLHAFKQGLANALTAKGRQVIDIVLDELTPFSLGMLIALYERGVAYYAELIGINAFHQPGVQSYKLASDAVNAVGAAAQGWVAAGASLPWQGTASQAAMAMGIRDSAPELEGILAKYAANGRRIGRARVSRTWNDGWVYRFAAE